MFPWQFIALACALLVLGVAIGALAYHVFRRKPTLPPPEQQRATVGDIPGRGFRGSISDLGLGAILNLISLEKKSGVLTVWRDDTIGHITIRGGEVLAARIEIRRDTAGEEAVYALLQMPDGTFVFEPKSVNSSAPAMKSVTHLLMESARRADQAKR